MFFKDTEILESFPQDLIDEFLNKKVYSVMLSLPTVNQEEPVEETAPDENPPEPVDNFGLIELRMSSIIYGNGDPLKPSQDS